MECAEKEWLRECLYIYVYVCDAGDCNEHKWTRHIDSLGKCSLVASLEFSHVESFRGTVEYAEFWDKSYQFWGWWHTVLPWDPKNVFAAVEVCFPAPCGRQSRVSWYNWSVLLRCWGHHWHQTWGLVLNIGRLPLPMTSSNFCPVRTAALPNHWQWRGAQYAAASGEEYRQSEKHGQASGTWICLDMFAPIAVSFAMPLPPSYSML